MAKVQRDARAVSSQNDLLVAEKDELSKRLEDALRELANLRAEHEVRRAGHEVSRQGLHSFSFSFSFLLVFSSCPSHSLFFSSSFSFLQEVLTAKDHLEGKDQVAEEEYGARERHLYDSLSNLQSQLGTTQNLLRIVTQQRDDLHRANSALKAEVEDLYAAAAQERGGGGGERSSPGRRGSIARAPEYSETQGRTCLPLSPLSS